MCVFLLWYVLCVHICVCTCVCVCACVYIHVDVGVYMCTCACVLCVCVSTWVWGVACCKADWYKAHKGHFTYVPIHTYTIYIYCILYIKSILHNILCTHMHTYVIVMETSLCYTLESMQVYLTCNVNSNLHKINILRMDIWTC